MKRKKTLLILGGVLVVLCGVIAAEKLVQRHVDTIQNAEEQIFAANADTLTEISWKSDDGSLDFVKTDGTWQSTDDADFPVDQDAIAEFIDHYSDIETNFIIEDVDDYSQYGLENPQCTITFSTEEDSTTISIGNYSDMDSERYISLGDGRVFLVEDDPMSYITTTRDDFMANDELVSFEDIEQITVSGEDNLDIRYEPDAVYTYTDVYDYYLIDGSDHLALSTSNVGNYMYNLTSIDFSDYVTYKATEDDLATYGLDEPNLVITVSGTYDPEEQEEDTEDTESTETETTAKDDSKDDEDLETTSYTVSLGLKDGDTDNVYLLVDGSSIIYKATIDHYNELSTGDYNSLRPTSVVLADWTKVDSLDCTVDDESFTMIADNSGDTTEWSLENGASPVKEDTETEDADTEDTEEDASDFYTAVTDAIDSLEITEFNDETPSKELECSAVLHLENEDYPTLTIEVYQYDGDSCLVQFNGETLGLVDRSSAIDLKEAINAILLNQ